MKDNTIQNIAVIGGGSWATALVKIISENSDVKINWWQRNEESVQHIRTFKRNPKYLSDVQIDLAKVNPTSDLSLVLRDVDMVVLVVPAAFLLETLENITAEDLKDKIVVSAVKGMVPKQNILFTDYLITEYQVPKEMISVIAGPCHAEEVAMERMSYLTIGADKEETGDKVAKLLSCRYVNANVLCDITGIEYCAIIKNVVSIACGIAHGLNYGDNFQAVLVSNAMMEIERFIKHIENKNRDYVQTAYLGDLLVTAYSQFSRNRTFGNMVGRGYSVRSAKVEMNMVAEGYYATQNIYEIMQGMEVEMPVVSATFRILYEKVSPRLEFQLLCGILK